MISNLGHFLLIVLILLSGVVSLPSIAIRKLIFTKYIKLLFGVLFGVILTTILLLEWAFIKTDLSLELVYLNSHHMKPLIFKIAGVWANHEGSMLLWLLVLALSGLIYIGISKSSDVMQRWVLVVQAFSICIFSVYVYFTSNPFIANILQPAQGLGLNPILQDIGLVFHPPSLYFGYVGFSIAYAIVIGMCMHGKFEQALIHDLKIWSLFSWSVLTLGIMLGSIWSYRELGWGGYWFWDPVENASVIPWLIGNALLHSIFLYERRKVNFHSMIIYAILTYFAAIIGTFIVRSGMLNSVHTFASDPKRGFILLLIACILLIFGFVALSLVKNGSTKTKYKLLSKELMLISNNILMLSAAAIITFATLYPLIMDMFFGIKLVIGAKYFNIVLLPIAIFTVFGSILAVEIKWGQDTWRRLRCELQAEVITCALCLYFFVIFPFLVALTTMVILVYVVHIYRKYRQKLDYSTLCSEFIHFGFALLLFSVIANAAFETEVSYKLQIGEAIEFDDKQVVLEDIRYFQKDNYLVRQAVLDFGGQKAYPENRIYIAEDSTAHQSYQIKHFVSDYYFSIHAADNMEPDEIIVNIVLKSCVNLIWIAGYVMVLGAMAKVLLYLSRSKRNLERK